MMLTPASAPPMGGSTMPGTTTPAPGCTASKAVTSPAMFSMSNATDAPMMFDQTCSNGAFITGFNITLGVASTGAVNNRIYAVQGVCSSGNPTANISLTNATKCGATFTAGAVTYQPSQSTPAAFWNTYYR